MIVFVEPKPKSSVPLFVVLFFGAVVIGFNLVWAALNFLQAGVQ
jgi:hypothetical protein